MSIVIAATFLGGTIGVDYAFAADPCDQAIESDAPSDAADHDGHHHHDHNANKIGCPTCPCCAVASTLPAVPAFFSAPRQPAFVVYTELSPRLIGRSIAPDPSPPRPSA